MIDRFKQRGVHRWMRRQTKKALERLRRIFEEPSRRGARPRGRGRRTSSWKAPRFGAHAAAAREAPQLPSNRLPARMAPARLRSTVAACAAALDLRPGSGLRRRTTRASRSPPARASRSTWRAWTTTCSSPASSTSRSRRTRPTTRGPPAPARQRALRHLRPGLQPRFGDRADHRRLQGARQPGQRVQAHAPARGQRLRLPAHRAGRGRLPPRGRQRGPARPHGRLDAAVRVPAREHREPPAGAGDRRALRPPQAGPGGQDRRAGPLARSSASAPATSTPCAAGAATAPPAPARTSSTATAIRGLPRGSEGGEPGVGVARVGEFELRVGPARVAQLGGAGLAGHPHAIHRAAVPVP